MPLRLKLLVAVIVLVFAGLAVSNVVTYTSLRSSLLNRVDQQLAAAEEPVKHALSEGARFGFQGGLPGSSQFPAGTYGEVRNSTGTVLDHVSFTYGGNPLPRPSLPSKLPRAKAPDAGPDLFSAGAASGSTRYRVLADAVTIIRAGAGREPGTLIVAIPLTDVEDTLARLRLIEG